MKTVSLSKLFNPNRLESSLRYSAAIAASLLLPQFSVAASEASQDKPEERWFEIEVILYKSTSTKGLTNESWDKDTSFTLPDGIIDFLNPIEEVEAADEMNSAEDTLQTEIVTDSSPLSGNKNIIATRTESALNEFESGTGEITEFSDEPVETPYLKLDDELLQLKKEAKRISVNPSFRLLNHFAWRQPVTDKSSALPIRIAGGHNYEAGFDYNGDQKLAELEVEQTGSEADGISDELSPFETSNNSLPNNQQYADEQNQPGVDQTSVTELTEEENQPNLDEDLDLSIVAEEKVPKLLPWVPELDGSATVYIYRNYLHFNTKVFYRRPDKQEVDMFNFANLSSLSDNSSDLTLDNILASEELSGSTTTTQSSELTWHYDDSFLEQDAEKVYTERLFNYPLIQTRRMRSTELHYFDHPLIGILVMIRPYELSQDVVTTE